MDRQSSSKGCNRTAYYDDDIWASNLFPKHAHQAGFFVTKVANFTTTSFAVGIGVKNQNQVAFHYRVINSQISQEVFAVSDKSKPSVH